MQPASSVVATPPCADCLGVAATAAARDAVRRAILTYFAACDVPQGADRSVLPDLFTADARWEGIGPAFSAAFGALVGRDAILAMLHEHLGTTSHYIENAHVVGEGLIDLGDADGQGARTATGRWVMQQTLVAPDGRQETRASRILARFRIADGAAAISHFSTERLARVIVDPSPDPHQERTNR